VPALPTRSPMVRARRELIRSPRLRMDEEFEERHSRMGRPATALAGPPKDWPARFEWRKLKWSSDRFTEMGEGIHGSHIGIADLTYFYGYHWWLGRSLVKGREVPWICATGHGGQRIFAVPALDLVAVVTAGLYADAIHGRLLLVIFNRYVLGAVLSKARAGLNSFMNRCVHRIAPTGPFCKLLRPGSAHLRSAGGSRFYRLSTELRKRVRLGATNEALSS
jgi:hypothetical protein